MNAVKKSGISLRYKILGLLTLIPAATLLIYLALALTVFRDDKVAFVFDSSSSMAGTLGTQVRTQLNSAISTLRPLFQDYLTTHTFSDLSQRVFENEFASDAIIVTSDKDGIFEKLSFLEKNPGLVAQLEPELAAIRSKVDKALKLDTRVILNLGHDDELLLVEKVENKEVQQSYRFYLVVKASDLAEMFASNGAQKVFLVNSDGTVIFGPSESEVKSLADAIPLQFMKKAEMNQGAETVKDEHGHELLVAYSKVGFADAYVVSSVVKETALGAIKILIRKSFIFFGLLLCATILISLFASSSLTQALTSLFNATKRVSEGKFDIKVDVKSTDEVGTLAENFNTMAQEVARLLDAAAEKARMEGELRTAKTVQETLFPDPVANLSGLEIAGYYEPASEIGGDWWHYCTIGDKIFLWIGDATGHGAPAALITSAAKSASAVIERLNVTPAKALELLNRCIYDVAKGKIQMTFFVASFDPATGELTYANASHEAPFLIRKSDEALKKKNLEALNEVNNPRLGQARDTQYKQTTVILQKGDAVFFYTDGIPDIQSPKEGAWGEREFLKALVSANKDYPSAKESSERFVKEFQSFRQGTTLIDDVTFFMIKNEV